MPQSPVDYTALAARARRAVPPVDYSELAARARTAQPTLADLVRAKHPGAYNDLTDQELDRLVRSKFPGAYDDVPAATSAQPRVLSTDPNAGEPIAQEPRRTRPFVADPSEWEVVGDDPAEWEIVESPAYLSTDPNAGEPLAGSANGGGRLPLASRGRESSMASSLAPAAGGLMGGLVGGIPGAVIGGAAGQGIGTLIEKGGEIPGALADVARNVFTEPVATMQGFAEGTTQGAIDTAKSAGIEGVSQLAGNKLAAAGGVLSKWLMNRATTRVTAKLMREFPDLSDTLIDNALTVSKGGYEKALGLLRAAKAKANAALKAADASGATVAVQMTPDLAESFKTALIEDVIKARGLQPSRGAIMSATNRLPAHLRTLFQQIDNAAANNQPLDLVPSHADVLKRRLQLESKPSYAQRGAPNGPRAMGMDAAERAELASQINAGIDQVATGYKAANAEAKPMIGAVRGLNQAIRPSGNLYQAMVRPAVGGAIGMGAGSQSEMPGAGWAGALAGAAMTSPAGMSREAIILASPQVQQMRKQLPRASALALTELLGQLSRSQTPAPSPQE